MTGPGAHSPAEVCTCHSDPTDRDPNRCGYRLLADRVISLLNPPDDDAAEVGICLAAVEDIATYVALLPCTCRIHRGEVDPCGRCDVLGRVLDRPEER